MPVAEMGGHLSVRDFEQHRGDLSATAEAEVAHDFQSTLPTCNQFVIEESEPAGRSIVD